MALDSHGRNDGVDHELLSWIRSLAPRSSTAGRKGRPEFSPEDADYLRRIATDGTLKARIAGDRREGPRAGRLIRPSD